VSRRFHTPVAASIIAGVLLIGLTWVYLLATSVQNAFFDVIDTTGLLFAIFYVLTALATVVYYRRRVFSSFWDFLILGVLPLGAAGFLGWMFTESVQAASGPEIWSLLGIIGLGLIMMFSARFILRSPFFRIRRESAGSERRNRHGRTHPGAPERPLAPLGKHGLPLDGPGAPDGPWQGRYDLVRDRRSQA
jgi:hypothetical protein